MSLLMSIFFTFLWGAASIFLSYSLGSDYLPGLGEYRVPFIGIVFFGGMLYSLYRNRRDASRGDIQPWKEAAGEDYRLQRSLARKTGEERANSFLFSLLFMLPQLAVDCFFEFLYSLADEEEDQVVTPPED